MSDQKQSEDRSMSEILSSIRRIVTDEERNRREVDEERRRHEAESGASVFVLTDAMRDTQEPARAAEAPVDFETPLDLGAEMAEPAAFSPAPAPADPLEPATEFEAPLELGAQMAAPASLADRPAVAAEFSDPALTAEEVEDIVRRVVREELQGTIGQQISRKVKRMIREEVVRALGEDEDSDALI